ncbi:MAG TPA: flagellar basal body rod protein FlgB [Clostridiales bacterium]|jgi:flagellar basal-body rod protein FlgB|nr:flagellar basal body rod protein FlgB [Clostridiales bacterium]
MYGLSSDVGIALLQKSLDAVWFRQTVTLNNIANNDTPGYKSKSVEFSGLLKSALTKKGDNKEELLNALSDVRPKMVENKTTSARADGNNVDLDAENVALAKEQIQYQYLTASLSSHISRLRHVINEGKG